MVSVCSVLSLLLMLPYVHGALQGDHICYNEESNIELEQTKTTVPVRVRSYNWCFSFPPRCSNYRTEIKEVVKLQNITKTRLTEYCCDGYSEVKADTNETTECIPTCRGGCVQGRCGSPNVCVCNVGFEGRHCSQRCRHKMYGQNCRKLCKCRNGSLCDHKTGFCRCNAGWVGAFCEQPCPPGYYGMMCRNTCSDCGTAKCNPDNGECVAEDSKILFEWSDNVPTNIMRLSNDRIKAKQWIQMNGNGKIVMKNCTNLEGVSCSIAAIGTATNSSSKELSNGDVHLANLIGKTHLHHVLIQKNNTLLMNALNSSIANLTSDIGKLSKQVIAQQIEQRSRSLEIGDVQLPKMAIILEPQTIMATKSLDGDSLDVRNLDDNTMERAEKLVVRESLLEENATKGVGGDIRENSLRSVETSNGDKLAQKLDDEVGVTGKHESREDADSLKEKDDGKPMLQQSDEVLHILTLQTNNHTEPQIKLENPPMVPVVLVVLVLLILIALIAFGFIAMIRRSSETATVRLTRQPPVLTEPVVQCQEIALTDQINHHKPLPDIPSFTHSITRRIAQPGFYDRPSNNMSVISGLNRFGYSYTTCSNPPLVVGRTRSQKESIEHIYDEIKYADRQPKDDFASKR